MASRPIPQSFCTLFFSWHRVLPEGSLCVFSRWVRSRSCCGWLCSLPALFAGFSVSAPPATDCGPAASGRRRLFLLRLPASFNDVIDRIVEREHLFLAQMRHMHPMVETYLQDLKTDKDGNAYPGQKTSTFSGVST